MKSEAEVLRAKINLNPNELSFKLNMKEDPTLGCQVMVFPLSVHYFI